MSVSASVEKGLIIQRIVENIKSIIKMNKGKKLKKISETDVNKNKDEKCIIN